MADSTAMTVDFLRARLLSERSVSRAAKERADELAKRVEELEQQVRAVTAQRRQAERAAADVLAILEAQGFGCHLSDDADADDDSGSDDGEEEEEQQGAKSRGGGTACGSGDEAPAAAQGEAEDALSATAQPGPGGLSWKGRSVSPRKARQLKHKQRRSYLYLLSSSADSSPKYQMGQSCRKNKRRVELSGGGRSAAPDDDGGDAGSQKGRQDGSDFTDDGHADMDGEVGGDERSSGDRGGGGQYVIKFEKDGEMERVLERQAELIGQYEEEEKAQREWEKQYNKNRNANKGDVEAKSSDKRTTSTGDPSAGCLPNGSLPESPQTASQQNDAQREPNDEPAYVSAQESSIASTVTRQDHDLGAEISDGDSGHCGRNARSLQLPAIKAPSEGSPSSDTLDSKVSDWSSSQFHDHTDSQLETQSHQPAPSSIMHIESVLQALQRARISLSAKLSKPVPPSQVTLALPAPGDEYKEHDDLPANGDGGSSYREEVSSSSPARQEILALPAPEGYREGEDLPANDAGISVAGKLCSSSPPREEILALPAPGDDYRREIDDFMKNPVSAPGLLRLPTDSFPDDEKMFSGNGRGSGFSLAAAATRRGTGSLSSPAGAAAASSHGAATSAPSVSGVSAKQCCDDLRDSARLSVPISGRCKGIPGSGFLPGIPGLEEDLRRGKALGGADLFMQRAVDYTVSNKWML